MEGNLEYAFSLYEKTIEHAQKVLSDAAFEYRVVTPDIPWEQFYSVERKYTKDIADVMEKEIRKRYVDYKEKMKPFEEAYKECVKNATILYNKTLSEAKSRTVYRGGIFLNVKDDNANS